MTNFNTFLTEVRGFDHFYEKNRDDLNEKKESISNKYIEVFKSLDLKIAHQNNELDNLKEELSSCEKIIKSLITLKFTKIAFDENAEVLSIAGIVNPTNKKIQELEEEIKLQKNHRSLILTNIKQKQLDVENIKKQVDLEKLHESDDLKAAQQEYDALLSEKINLLRAQYESFKDLKPDDIKASDILMCPSGIPNENVAIANIKIDGLKHFNHISGENVALLPLLFAAQSEHNIFINADSQSNSFYGDEIENVIVGMVLNFLKSFPYKSLHFGAYSPRGNSFQKLSFLFRGLNKQKLTIGDNLFTSQNTISLLLSTVFDKADSIQKRLLESGVFSLYELYSSGTPNEPFQLLVLHDFISAISEENMNSLLGLVSMASSCGIRFIFIDDLNSEQLNRKSTNFKNAISQLVNSSISFSFTGTKFKDDGGSEVLFSKPESGITPRDIYDLTCSLEKNAVEKKNLLHEDIGFGTIINTSEVVETISIPIARSDSGIWSINFDCLGNADSPLANLIVGEPGTGKSKLIDSMILNGSMIYSPEDLVFELLDFKNGELARTYLTKDCQIPHIKVASEKCNSEEASIILDNIIRESRERVDRFKELQAIAGTNISNIVDYNKAVIALHNANYKKMPRIIIVVDECQVLFDDDKMARDAESIVRLCRSAGIHLLLSTQTISNNMRKTTGFINGIYCFYVKNQNDVELLDKPYQKIIEKEIPIGSHLAFASNKSGKECTKIAISYDGRNTSKYAKAIRERWKDYDIDTVIIGDRTGLVLKDDSVYKKYPFDENCLTVPIGENYVDHSDVTLDFRPLKQSGIIIVSPYDICSSSIFSSIIKTFVLNGCNVAIIDASRNEDLSEFKELKQVKYGNENNYLKMLSLIDSEYKRRAQNIREKYKPLLFVIHCSHNISDFKNNRHLFNPAQERKIDASAMNFNEVFANKNPNDNSMSNDVSGFDSLINLISNAYRVSIYVCFHIDSMTCVNDKAENIFSVYNGRNVIKQTDFKVVSGENAQTNAESVWISNNKAKLALGLNNNMAVLNYKEEMFLKFRFYQKGLK